MVFFMVIPVDLLGACRRFEAPVICVGPHVNQGRWIDGKRQIHRHANAYASKIYSDLAWFQGITRLLPQG
jgi:hypothetical protein